MNFATQEGSAFAVLLRRQRCWSGRADGVALDAPVVPSFPRHDQHERQHEHRYGEANRPLLLDGELCFDGVRLYRGEEGSSTGRNGYECRDHARSCQSGQHEQHTHPDLNGAEQRRVVHAEDGFDGLVPGLVDASTCKRDRAYHGKSHTRGNRQSRADVPPARGRVGRLVVIPPRLDSIIVVVIPSPLDNTSSS